MSKRMLRSTLTLALLVFVLTTSLVSVYAQTPTPPSRETLIEQIKGFAELDVKNNRPLNSKPIVDIYREQANNVGMTPLDIAKIYEEEYKRLRQEEPLRVHKTITSRIS